MFNRTNYIRVPNSRIGVIIGPKGSTKSDLEQISNSTIQVDSQTGEVAISPNEDNNDPLIIIKTSDVIKAIARGFTPDQAKKLFLPENYLEIINLRQIIGQSNKALVRIRSRLIGTQGKTRKTIEEYTVTSIVISGSTVSIIGEYVHLIDAKEAIMKIVQGANQTSVYSWLEERKKELLTADDNEIWSAPAIESMSSEELREFLHAEKDAEDIDLSEEFDKISDDE